MTTREHFEIRLWGIVFFIYAILRICIAAIGMFFAPIWALKNVIGFCKYVLSLYEEQGKESSNSARFEIEIGAMKWRKKDREHYLKSGN